MGPWSRATFTRAATRLIRKSMTTVYVIIAMVAPALAYELYSLQAGMECELID